MFDFMVGVAFVAMLVIPAVVATVLKARARDSEE